MSRKEPTRVAWLIWLSFSAFGSCQKESPSVLAAEGPSVTARVVASAAPSPSAEPATAPSPSRPLGSVLVLGDSLSDERVGGGGFVKVLRERCRGVTFDNRAKGGFMVNQIKKRLETEVMPEGGRYSHAIVFGGVNDLYSDQTANRTLPRIRGDLSKIYEALAARGTEVIAITVTPWGGFKRWYTPERGRNTLRLNAWISDLAANGVIAEAVDAYPLLSCGDPERLCPELAAPFKDGLHFGKLGHQKLAEALLAGPFRGCAA